MGNQPFVVVDRRGPSWLPGKGLADQPGIDKHVAYLEELLRAEKLMMSGSFEDDTGGLAILYVESEAEARRVASKDAVVRNGVLQVEIHPFSIGFRNNSIPR